MAQSVSLTRYLYPKDQVRESLISSILQKEEDESLFWALELYFSGWTQDLFRVFWYIYIHFYASLHPYLGVYLLNKIIELQTKIRVRDNSKPTSSTSSNQPILPGEICMILKNFLTRPFNLDVFILKKITEIFENEEETPTMIQSIIEDKKYKALAYLLLEQEEELSATIETVWIHFSLMEKKEREKIKENREKCMELLKKTGIMSCTRWQEEQWRLWSLSNVLYCFYLQEKVKTGKKLYVKIPEEELQSMMIPYETIEVDLTEIPGKKAPKFPAHKILSVACVYPIKQSVLPSLQPPKPPQPPQPSFYQEIQQRKQEIQYSYQYNWLYHASFSPVWKERIEKYGGKVLSSSSSSSNANVNVNANAIGKVIFEDSEKEEEFYRHYGYEPDEQKREIQEKSYSSSVPVPYLNLKDFIVRIQQKQSIQKKDTKRGVFEIPEEYLNEMEEVIPVFDEKE